MVPDSQRPGAFRPRALAADLRSPQVLLGLAVWGAFFAVILALSARA
jgi:hypothetical protein